MRLSEKQIIDKTVEFVKHELEGAEGGHDWWHIYRVWKIAVHIAQNENVDLFIVELGTLLHDIADSKFNDGDESVGPSKAADFLNSLDVDDEVIAHIVKIIENVSFKGGNHKQQYSSPELDIIQDADRLDAIGAIGIARTFNFGGHKNRALYDPQIKPNLKMTKEEYKKNTAPTINHFYEKLLLLKERMNTNTGKALAEKRHAFMEQYLDEFFREWDGKC